MAFRLLGELLDNFNENIVAGGDNAQNGSNGSESDIDDDLIVPLEGDSDNENEVNEEHVTTTTTQLTETEPVDLDRSTDTSNPPVWSNQLENVRINEFTGQPGVNPQLGLHNGSTPYEIFQTFLPDTFFQLVADQTNIYAANNNPPKSWMPVKAAHIKQYFFINIMFGVKDLPDYKMYWSNDSLLNEPSISQCMSRRQYEQINRFFHLNDSANYIPRGQEGHDPIYKIRPMFDTVLKASKSNFYPEREVSFDEAMVQFTGRLSFKQYMKGKPCPWGVKVWCCADSRTGYLWNFKVYTGKNETASRDGQGHDVITGLGDDLLGKFHHFYFDNFFSSVKLALDLLEKDTYSCATFRSNRKGWPADLKEKQPKGSLTMRQAGNMLATTWVDKRQVNVLSTNCNPTETTALRNTAAGRVEKILPTPVQTYNSFMGGVDLHDQNRSYYPVGRRSVKWWRCMVWFLLQVSIINSYQMYKHMYKRSATTLRLLTHFEFRLEIIRALKQPSIRRRDNSETTQTGSDECTSVRLHAKRKKTCSQCRKANPKRLTPSGRPVETSYGCSRCNIHLCKGRCFHEHLEGL